jgi:hypothetical protein
LPTRRSRSLRDYTTLTTSCHREVLEVATGADPDMRLQGERRPRCPGCATGSTTIKLRNEDIQMFRSQSVLRAIEPARDSLLDRLPDPSHMDLPKLELLGRRADETVDRWRGRPRRPIWAWVLAAIAITGIAIAAASVVMSWNRNRGEPWRDDALEGSDRISETGSLAGPDLGASADLPVTRRSKTGLTAAEGSLLSYDPVEGRDA